MNDAADRQDQPPRNWFFPPAQWLPKYQAAWLGSDVIAGVTLAAYAIPVSLAYAALAGLPPQVGVYGYLLGGLGYALFGSSRQLAIGPTSAISLMIAGTVGAMADGDAQRYVQIASLAAFTVAALCLLSWLLKLSALVKLISDSILVGFKIGAGLTIAMTQLPSLFGVAGGGHNFFERVALLAMQIGQMHYLVLAVGVVAIVLLLLGQRLLPGRPVALAVVALAIAAATVLGLPALGVPTTGEIPAGLPSLAGPALRLRDVEGIVPLAVGCLLLAYVEGISAARTFAAKHGYALDPRQEFLGIGAANLFTALGQGYPVAGGLSQSAVNDKAGARTPLALVFASITLALCLLFLTGLLENLPKAVLAAVVLTAIAGLFDFPALLRMWRVSRLDFYAAAIALVAVLLLGILQGILLAALASVVHAPDHGVASARRVPRPHSRHEQLFRPRPSPGKRGAVRRRRVPARRVAALHQCRGGAGGGSRPPARNRCRRHPPGDLRSLRVALYRPCRRPHAARPAWRTDPARHRAAHRRRARTRARPAACRRVGRKGRRSGQRDTTLHGLLEGPG